jgi:hypothetical protein
MAALHCLCKKRSMIRAEFWWKAAEDKHGWVYFDDDEASQTYTQSVTHCPGCGEELHRRMLSAAA